VEESLCSRNTPEWSQTTECLMPKPGIEDIWRQKVIPVVYRPPSRGDLIVKLPFNQDNRVWLSEGRKSRPVYNSKFQSWTLPRSSFSEVVERLLRRFQTTYIIQSHRELEKCAPACWDAKGFECSCSCMGMNHGTGMPGGRWYIVSDTCAVQWQDRELRWSLLKLAPEAPRSV